MNTSVKGNYRWNVFVIAIKYRIKGVGSTVINNTICSVFIISVTSFKVNILMRHSDYMGGVHSLIDEVPERTKRNSVKRSYPACGWPRAPGCPIHCRTPFDIWCTGMSSSIQEKKKKIWNVCQMHQNDSNDRFNNAAYTTKLKSYTIFLTTIFLCSVENENVQIGFTSTSSVCEGLALGMGDTWGVRSCPPLLSLTWSGCTVCTWFCSSASDSNFTLQLAHRVLADS